MSKTIVTIALFQLAVAAKDYEPDGAPYATEREAEEAKVEMARERLAGRWDTGDDLRQTLEDVGLDGEVENFDALEDIDGLTDAVVVRLAEQYIDFSAAIYPVDVAIVVEDVEAAIEKSGVTTTDRDDLEEGCAAAFHTFSSWEKGDLAGAVYGLQGWYEGVIERLPGLTCAEDDDEEDHEDDLHAADEEAAMEAKGLTPEVFNDRLPTTFIFTYGDGSLGDIRDKAAERYATLETIRAVPGNRRAIIAEVQLLDEATGHYKVIRCHARH